MQYLLRFGRYKKFSIVIERQEMSIQEPPHYLYRPLSTFVECVQRDTTMVLDNDPVTLERDRSRIQNALKTERIGDDSLRIVATEESDEGNVFIFNTGSRDHADRIREYFTRKESETRYDVSVDTRLLPLAQSKNESMRFLQETVIVHRRAFKQYPRPLAKSFVVYGVASSLALYLLYVIVRIGLKLLISQ